MSLKLHRVKWTNDDGSCWTCQQRGHICDYAMPACRACTSSNLVCAGYTVRLRWPTTCHPANTKPCVSVPAHLSEFGLPSSEAYLMQHFAKNLTRIALAVDYDGNGYRRWIQIAIGEPLLLHAILAVAASHYARWQQIKDTDSETHLSQALVYLQKRLQDPTLVNSETTLAAMMFLLSYEVFNGSDRWKHHYFGIMGWIRAFSQQTTIDPFVKTWISMVDTQSALNLGVEVMPQVESWVQSTAVWSQDLNMIDPLFGCTTKLPGLMLRAARLQRRARAAEGADPPTRDELTYHIRILQSEVKATALDINSDPSFAVSCHDLISEVTPIPYLDQHEMSARAVAVAEIFRHATIIYLARIVDPPEEMEGESEIQASLDSVADLLPMVPDVLGPGSNLGWALVVIGSEIDDVDQRDYIRCRLRRLRSLGLNNVLSGEKVLEEVWRNRDTAKAGCDVYRRWQDIMHDLSVEQILI